MMNTNHLELTEDVLDFIVGESQIDVWILTVSDNQFYIYKKGGLEHANMDFDTAVTLMHPDDAPRYVQIYNDILAGTVSKNQGNFRTKDADGNYRHYNIRFMRHTDAQGNMDYMLCTRCDITAKVEQHQKQTELINQFTGIFNQLPYAFLTFDNEGKVLNANELAISMSREKFHCDIHKVNIIQYYVYNDEHREAFCQHRPFTYTLSTQLDGEAGMPFCQENIEHFFVGDINYIPIQDRKGRFIVNLLLVRDITQDTLRERENVRFQKKLYILDEHFHLTRILLNPHKRVIQQMQHTDNGDTTAIEWTVEDILQRTHPHDRDALAETFRKACNLADETLEVRFRILHPNTPDYRHEVMTLVPDHGPENEVIAYSGKMRDMTDEVQGRQKLEDRMKQIQALNEKYKISLWEYDMEKDELVSDNEGSNNPLYRSLNMEEYIKTLHPDDQSTARHFIEEMRNHTFKMEPYVFRHYMGPDTPYIYLHYVPSCVRDESGEIKRYIFICRDITQEREQLHEITRYATHTHQINKSCGITLWKYNPYTRIFHNIDPYLDEYSPDMSADDLLRFTHPNDKDTVSQYLGRSAGLCTDMQQFHCHCAWENSMDYRYYNFIQMPFFDENGTLTEYGITRIDETEKEQTDRMLRFSQEVGKVGSWSIDLRTGKHMHTEEIHTLLELDVDDPDFDIRSCIYEEDRPEFNRLAAESKEQGTDFSYILRFKTPGGKIKWMESRCIAIKDTEDKVAGYYGTLTDVTDMHRARLKAEESDQLKSAFLANMSHEIRTPLNSIVGFSDILVTEDLSPEDKREFGKIIRSNNEQLLTLINDILDLSKLESGCVEFTETDFGVEELLGEIFSSYQPRFRELPTKLVYVPKGKSIRLHQDRQRLIEVLTNFVNNAIKYTSEGSITLDYEKVDQGVKFTVTDTGVGMPPEALDKIFNRFEKLGSMVKGTGLGLSICKMLADRMHGKIGVDSTLGKGSTFWFWLEIAG